jgi:riboflavin kinase/FMN adenylyltransferase
MSVVVSVGVFDGLHLGHRAILDRALSAAREAAGRCVVISFDPHPDVVLATPFQAVLPLTPLPEKRERLMALGVDDLVVLPFTRELAALTPEAFVHTHLVEPFGLDRLVVGEDFALGRGRSGNVTRLEEIGRKEGFAVDAVRLLQLDDAPVSSTRIRELLAGGNVAGAATLLGRAYDLSGVVVKGEAVGRTLGYPTANIRLQEEKFLPADGIYATWVTIEGGSERVPGAMSIGVRPTFGGKMRTLEVHLLDWSGDLVGRNLTIEMADWLRPELHFEGLEPLIEAMGRDVAETRRRLGLTPA